MIRRLRKSQGFSFLEIIAVMALMTAIIGVAVGYLSSSTRNLKNAAYNLSRDIQSTYSKATKEAEFQRLLISADRKSYELQKFIPPQPKPIEDERDPQSRKKVEEWEEAQRQLENMNALERTALTRLQRGSFRTFKNRQLPGDIRIKTFLTARGLQEEKKDEKEPLWMMFFPSGEVDQTLIVIDDGQNHSFSLSINPLSGRVTSSQGEITEQEWKKSTKGE